MKNNKKLTLAAATFGIAALAMGGSTFAWFQVVNTANLALQGTIVGVDNNLQVGFRTPAAVTDAALLGLVDDTTLDTPVFGLTPPEYVYWAPNSVTANVMDAIMLATGHTSGNVIKPITTGSYAADEAIGFYSKPVFNANRTLENYPLVADVTKADYLGFTIIFRAIDQDEVAVSGQEVFLDVGTAFNGSQSVTDALRLGFDNGTDTDILHPTAVAAADIDVGGPLDLNGDSVFDYTLQTYTGGTPNDILEIAYGEFTAGPVWSATANGTAAAEPYSNEQFWVGATGDGVRGITSYTAAVAEYNIISAYQDGGTALATTDVNGLAEIDMYMWLEGWDHACVNGVAEATIGATLTFIAPEA